MKIMITKNIIMGQLIKQEPKAYEILTGFGMHCLGCPSSQMESLEDACMVHGIDVQLILSRTVQLFKMPQKRL